MVARRERRACPAGPIPPAREDALRPAASRSRRSRVRDPGRARGARSGSDAGPAAASVRQLQGAAAPNAVALATLSADPPGATEPTYPIDLMRAAKLELRYTRGILLNFNSDSTLLAASFLRDLEREELDVSVGSASE